MRYIDIIEKAAGLFSFKEVFDKSGSRYILLSSSAISEIGDVRDKTAFEAVENHVHLLDKVAGGDMKRCKEIGTSLGKALYDVLSARYPSLDFFVYVTVTAGDSMIIRFHQKWENEHEYYDLNGCSDGGETVICFHK